MNTLRDEFFNVFEGDKRLRCIRDLVIADVHTLTETTISLSARRLNPEQYQALKMELKRLIDQGVLERCQSPWTSPIVMVKKKSGGWRLCADFTQLNKLLKIQKYALTNINDFASIAHGCKWLSSIDIADAYNIPVNPLHRHKLTITIPLSNYCYNYLPMGLFSNSCYYQLLMNEVVSGLPQVYCYLDDLIIMFQSYEEHVQLLRQVFSRLCEHGLVVKESKCFFAVHSLSFLGYHVSPKGLGPLPSKVSAIKDYQLPRTKRQLKAYLEMYQFYARFVKGYAELLQPLHDFATQCPPRRPLSWNKGLVSCFQASKKALTNVTLLAFPDPDVQTKLVTDASGTTIECVLQPRKERTLTPLAFWSIGLTKRQLHWSTFKRELFACYASLKHFRYYLEAQDFTRCTDHRPIVTNNFIAQPEWLHPDKSGSLTSSAK